MPYRYPRWVNGMAGLTGATDFSVMPEDRMTEAAWFGWVDSGRTAGLVQGRRVPAPGRRARARFAAGAAT